MPRLSLRRVRPTSPSRTAAFKLQEPTGGSRSSRWRKPLTARLAYRKNLGWVSTASAAFAAEPPSYPNGCHVCEVEVEPESGAVRIDRYVAVDDVGRVINPLIVDGQIHGGLAQGIGQALLERVAYDSDGQILTGNFTDYAMPRADDMPSFEVGLNEMPAKTNPLGVEAGCVGAPPAVMNAVLDALRPLGVTDLKCTPQRVWSVIAEAATHG